MYQMSLKKVNDSEFKPNTQYVNGLENYQLIINQNNDEQLKFIQQIDYNDQECSSTVHFKLFPPSSVVIFKVVLNQAQLSNINQVRSMIHSVDSFVESLSYDELNIILYRCSQEEQNEIQSGCYALDSYGELVYAGLQGIMNILEKERLNNNLGHPLFDNLRRGNWLMEYTASRLEKYVQIMPERRQNLLKFSQALKSLFNVVAQIPRYLIPKYFDLIVSNLYFKLTDRVFNLMKISELVKNGSAFVRSLALGGVSLCGNLKNSSLPNTIIDELSYELKLSMSAGLPHFSSTYMRNWGRDTFISLRGLLLLTGRFNDARNLILAYGSCLRHGLIPNLLGEGKFSRYNCRDAVWFWLKSIKGKKKFNFNITK
jgi:glycogen debranching enzyme